MESTFAVAASALRDLARDPGRLDRVFDLGVALNARRLPAIIAKIERDEAGRRLLAEQPAIDSAHVDFDALARLPDGTLGREYVRFLRDNKITPDVFKKPPLADARAAYLMQRVRQTHDLWHVLTGYTPDVRGEIVLQAFTFAQLGAPSALMLTLLGLVKARSLNLLRDVMKGYRRGRATQPLALLDWESYWEMPVEELRRRLTCPSA